MKILAAMCFGALLTAAAFLFMRREDDEDDYDDYEDFCPDEVEDCEPGNNCKCCGNTDCAYYPEDECDEQDGVIDEA